MTLSLELILIFHVLHLILAYTGRFTIRSVTQPSPYGLVLLTGVAARETAQALRSLAQAARGVAASSVEPQAAAGMLDSACHVMEGSAMLIHEAHQALVCPGDAESQQRLAQVGRRNK